MTYQEFKDIFDNDEMGGSLLKDLEDDNAVLGLLIIRDYIRNAGIEGADHDLIFSVDAIKLVEAGITREDAERLHKLNWMIWKDEECMACFV